MPFFEIKTNKALSKLELEVLLKKTSAFVAETLGKPERVVMTAILPDTPLFFGGDARPAALVTLKSIGLARDRCPDFSAAICGYLETEFQIAPDRVFIDFTALDGGMFGWNGKTF